MDILQAQAKNTKLPYFKESKDQMDNYISHSEKFAITDKWDKRCWAINQSALLKGRLLKVYDRYSNEGTYDLSRLRKL